MTERQLREIERAEEGGGRAEVEHVAGEPVGNVQACSRCRKVLVDYLEEGRVNEQRPVFFTQYARVIEVAGTLTTGRGLVNVPACRPS